MITDKLKIPESPHCDKNITKYALLKSLTNVFLSLPIGSPVTQIVANDKDSEENTNLQFSLDGSVKNIFDILNNGTIITKTRLDRETIDFYTFEVTVADSADTQVKIIHA